MVNMETLTIAYLKITNTIVMSGLKIKMIQIGVDMMIDIMS